MASEAELPNRFDCTCGRLRKLTRRVTQIYDHALESKGLTIAQFGLLAPLHAGGEMTISALAERMVTDPTTLTRNLAPLQRDGLVKIAPSREDRRRKIVSLTTRGRTTLREALPAWQQAQRQVAEALGDVGLAKLVASLDDSLNRLSR
jgi:DNA-binding MarR family transcriptional regulator